MHPIVSHMHAEQHLADLRREAEAGRRVAAASRAARDEPAARRRFRLRIRRREVRPA